MSLMIFDTMQGKKREFHPLVPNQVSMYVCGITPYAHSHLGHARCYVAFDVIYRTLCHLGYQVKYVRNFTDVDDKIINRAHERNMNPLDLAQENIDSFYEDMDALQIARPQIEPRVSTSIPEIIEIIETLIKKSLAYEVGGDVFYAVGGFENYGQLSKRTLEELEAGARVEVNQKKKDPMDFALWKSAKPGEINWDSPWGKGRPGWHIECSAMSLTHLGEKFDLHGGGMDLQVPHHENEIAQSDGATGHCCVGYWLHNGFVNVDSQKMSKSLGNVFNIKDLYHRYTPITLRYFLMSGGHYRKPINFSDTMLNAAAERIAYFYETLSKINDLHGQMKDIEITEKIEPEIETWIKSLDQQVTDSLKDDFNVTTALSVLSDVFKKINDLLTIKKAKAKQVAYLGVIALMDFVNRFDQIFKVFHLDVSDYLTKHNRLSALRKGLDLDWIETQITARAQARENKEWAKSDEIRDALAQKGVVLMDGASGSAWKVSDL
jgi:cysteinyl-tRNA synthetase